MELSIRREGEFVVTWFGSNATQCGVNNTQILRYVVVIVGDQKHLTPEGFVIDNQEIHRYFMLTYKDIENFESCERIAIKACYDFRDKFGRDHLKDVKVKSISVTIGNGQGAGLTAIWRSEEERRARAEEVASGIVKHMAEVFGISPTGSGTRARKKETHVMLVDALLRFDSEKVS